MLVNAERIIGRFEQQPGENKRYRADFTANLAAGETITTPVFVVDQVTTPPLVVSNIAVGPDGDQVVFFVGGGLDGTVYKVTMTTNTSDGQVLEDELEFRVTEV